MRPLLTGYVARFDLAGVPFTRTTADVCVCVFPPAGFDGNYHYRKSVFFRGLKYMEVRG